MGINTTYQGSYFCGEPVVKHFPVHPWAGPVTGQDKAGQPRSGLLTQLTVPRHPANAPPMAAQFSAAVARVRVAFCPHPTSR